MLTSAPLPAQTRFGIQSFLQIVITAEFLTVTEDNFALRSTAGNCKQIWLYSWRSTITGVVTSSTLWKCVRVRQSDPDNPERLGSVIGL